jgi:hypothetical protein
MVLKRGLINMAFSTFVILCSFLFVISVWIYCIIEILRGNVKWDNANTNAFMPPKSVFDLQSPIEHSDHLRRMCDGANISHGHSPGVPYIRS